MSQRKANFAQHGLLAVLVTGVLLVGAISGRSPAGQSARTPPGQKGVSDSYPPGHFLAGGERSVPILEEVSATLKRMDERLARLEKIAVQMAESGQKE